MKFKVREGFVVHHSKVVEIDLGNDEVKKEVQTQTYYQRQGVEFTAAEAEEHLHKLEPADKAAQDYMAARAVPASEPVAAGGVDHEALAATVAAAVAQALAAAKVAG